MQLPTTTAAILPLLLLLTAAAGAGAGSFPDRYHKPPCLSAHSHSHSHSPQQYIELTHPLPSSLLAPACTHRIVAHSFANTIDSPPFSAPYSPPPPSLCPTPPWSSVALELSVSSRGDQYDRIAAVWLGGVELLRTSTAEPNEDGIFWRVRKDVTRFSSLLSRSNIEVTMMLENIINDEFTGIYHVNVTLLFYSSDGGNRPRVSTNQLSDRGLSSKSGLGLEEFGGNSGAATEDSVNLATLGAATWNYNSPPPDLILPVSDDGDRGSWYRIERASDLHSKTIRIPANTVRAVLELCVSFHGNDEFWYSNPPDSYIRENNLTTGRGNGAYREVLVMIDGNLVGSEVPFPVVFTGGINPLFWEPIVAIGAFILPSYDMELTPFLGRLLDRKAHELAIGVANGISYWLVNANLHLWLDHGSKRVQAKSVAYTPPAHNVERESQFKELDGSFKVKAKRKAQFAGWVESSAGNLTTIVSTEYRVKNSISFTGNGTYKLVKQKMKAKREVRIRKGAGVTLSRAVVRRSYPLRVITSTLPGSKKDTYVLVTNLSHALMQRYSDGDLRSSVRNVQDSRGWMEVKDHNVLSGTAGTKQSYSFRDEFFCYSRKAEAADGKLIGDHSTFACAGSL
ncbi:peptide-N4-(N-acetyl-beta-glucosaminyl)asparagine amidase A [Rhodamnia argentea]|uniref:Peptide-N4-(N-acetyl-beta- glucosaminyl)asparagine amidase A n=1 Tax=Rhodamnia argentea TaxID=178133 RepID=A0A8B8PZV7_9MYRT|nr:peptide-N4-(N-acetyl-beta-glucosaminyl)asparagine amidase A [Rhodamnia argentea]